MRWFRFYSDVLDDPKVQRISPELFKHWVNLLCLAGESEPRGYLPKLSDIAFRLRISERKAESILTALVARGLLDAEPNSALRPHNWDGRQPRSDNVTERVQKHREKQDEPVTGNVSCNVSETPQTRVDTDTEKTRRERENVAPAEAPARAREPGAADAAPAPPPVRPDQEMWDAFGAVIGGSPSTKSERGKWNQGIKQLRDAGITADRIPRLVSAYRTRYGDIDCNPMAVAANLTALQSPARASPNGSSKQPRSFDVNRASNAVLLDRSRYGE